MLRKFLHISFLFLSFGLSAIASECNFNEIIRQSCPGTVSSVSIGDSAHCRYRITATPTEGYEFIGWSDGNTDAVREVSVDSVVTQISYVARFIKIMCTYKDTIIATAEGTVTSTKTGLIDDCSYTIEAVPNDGYHFVMWSDSVTENPRDVELYNAQQQYKAYFQGPERSVILWQGTSEGFETNWNDRGNWLAQDGDSWVPLTCVNPLSSNLKVIIPEPNSTKYTIPEGGVDNYPVIPDEVTGYGVKTPDGKYTDSFFIEYGGALKGVENLTQDEQKLYSSAEAEFVASRKEWILVGTVVQPFTDDATAVRNIKSGDFYIAEQKPLVYMHQAYIDGDTVAWDKEFTSLEVEVPADKVFAIHIPDMYGPYKLSAASHYAYFEPNPSMTGDGDKAKTYNFNGRFYNDAFFTTYTGLTSGKPNLICNTYPCNLDPSKIADNVQVFHYNGDITTGSFGVWKQGDVIKPQHGFVYTAPSAETTFTVTEAMLTDGGTKYKSAEVQNPSLYLQVRNSDSKTNEGSYVVLRQDALVSGAEPDFYTDAQKLFVTTSSVPELYIERYGERWAGVSVPDAEVVIPLGLKLGENMSVEFALLSVDGFDNVTLEDRASGDEYDMLNDGAVKFDRLAEGDLQGRFFLNVSASGDLTTSAADAEEGSLQIFVAEDGIHIDSFGSELLESATVYNMAGQKRSCRLSGSHAVLEKPATAGVYIIKVTGCSESKVLKFIVK